MASTVDPASGVKRSGRVALVGRPNVGKSTLLNALVGARLAITSPHPQTTRDRIAGILTTEDAQLVFLDTPGLQVARAGGPKTKLGERMNALSRGAAGECDVAVFVTDVGAAPSPEVTDDDRAVRAVIPASTPAVLVVNKIDRVKDKALLLPLLEAHAKELDYRAVVPVSALKGKGIERVVGEIAKLLPAGPALYPEDELSDRPMRFFVAELVREQVLKHTREEVPHGVAVVVDEFEEGRDLVRVALTIHVAKASHKGILIGGGGRMLRAIGSAARKRAEGLIGKKVHLAVFVRATPKWFDDPARLADLGYAAESGASRGPSRGARKRKAKKRNA